MRKLWITGSNGQLGQALNQVLDPMEFEVINTEKDDLNVADIDAVISFGDVNRPDIIINCSGLTGIEECERNPAEAYRVNAIGARNLAIIAAKLSAKMIQISTDDVFDGKANRPYTEFDPASPITVYGNSKLAGENFVREFTHKHFIIRSSWTYGLGNNFVTNVLKLARNGETVYVKEGEISSPTSDLEIAKFILYIMNTNEYGTYHVTCNGICSRKEFAEEILALAGMQVPVMEIKDSDYQRPEYAVLNNFILEILGDYQLPDWKKSLKEFMKVMEERR